MSVIDKEDLHQWAKFQTPHGVIVDKRDEVLRPHISQRRICRAIQSRDENVEVIDAREHLSFSTIVLPMESRRPTLGLILIKLTLRFSKLAVLIQNVIMPYFSVNHYLDFFFICLIASTEWNTNSLSLHSSLSCSRMSRKKREKQNTSIFYAFFC